MDENGFALDVSRRNENEALHTRAAETEPAIGAVVAVVAEHEKLALRHCEFLTAFISASRPSRISAVRPLLDEQVGTAVQILLVQLAFPHLFLPVLPRLRVRVIRV